MDCYIGSFYRLGWVGGVVKIICGRREKEQVYQVGEELWLNRTICHSCASGYWLLGFCHSPSNPLFHIRLSVVRVRILQTTFFLGQRASCSLCQQEELERLKARQRGKGPAPCCLFLVCFLYFSRSPQPYPLMPAVAIFSSNNSGCQVQCFHTCLQVLFLKNLDPSYSGPSSELKDSCATD